MIRRTALTPGYMTKDDLGTDGDDTIHMPLPYYPQPNVFLANASFPSNGGTPQLVDFVFVDFLEKKVLEVLNRAGAPYGNEHVEDYLSKIFTTNSYLPEYAKRFWQEGMPNCPVGPGIGSD
jgi:hypothetical protein